MIYECLACLAAEINVFLRARLKIKEDKVIVSAIVNQDGSVAIQDENKVLITLVNIERDISIKQEGFTGAAIIGNTARPLCIQLHLMISCYFSGSNYGESLKFLSLIIGFLQEKNVFNRANTPQLDESLEKLIFEMESFDPDRLNNIWATLGAKYMPSVFYKVRLIIFDAKKAREYRPAVSGISADSSA